MTPEVPANPNHAGILCFRNERLFSLLWGSSIALPSQGVGGPPLRGTLAAAWGCRRMLCLAGGPLGGQVPLPPVPEGVQLRKRRQVPHHQGSLGGKETAGGCWGLLPAPTRPASSCPAPSTHACQERGSSQQRQSPGGDLAVPLWVPDTPGLAAAARRRPACPRGCVMPAGRGVVQARARRGVGCACRPQDGH